MFKKNYSTILIEWVICKLLDTLIILWIGMLLIIYIKDLKEK